MSDCISLGLNGHNFPREDSVLNDHGKCIDCGFDPNKIDYHEILGTQFSLMEDFNLSWTQGIQITNRVLAWRRKIEAQKIATSRAELQAAILAKVEGIVTWAEYGGWDCGGVMMYLKGEKTDLGPDGNVNPDVLYVPLSEVLQAICEVTL